jgi:5'-3' exoribonuclease 2
MGVPGFFLWLCKKAKTLKCIDDIILNKPKDDIDWFLIDANCLIHPICFKVLAEESEDISKDKLEGKMINAVIEYTEKLISHVSPKKGVFFAIDGVAPVAKIKQQRYRRFKSIYDRNLENNIRKKHGKDKKKYWNNSAVTPGTEFMERLHHKLVHWFKNRGSLKIIYSSCKTPSEGEHKLLQFIKDNKKDNNMYSYAVYGLDADLIFLSLAANNPKTYLLRESQEFDKSKSSNELNYVSIDFLGTFIFNIINRLVDDKSDNNDLKLTDTYKLNIINDFIFICYLLGNDFLPHLESVNIYENGIDMLLDKYSDILISNGIYSFIITKKGEGDRITHNIDDNMFIELIQLLASEESENLKNKFVSKKKKYGSRSSDPYEVEMFNIENLRFKINDPIKLGSDESELWKKRYYEHYFPTLKEKDSFVKDGLVIKENDSYTKHINTMVYEYLKGLKWVTRYYFDSCPSWCWYYPYDYPPFLEDIRDYFSTCTEPFSFKTNMKFTYGRPLRPFNQLLMVLPPQSSFLVPYPLQSLMTDTDSELVKNGIYPLKIELDCINKHKHWMTIPQLPAINLKIVYDNYKVIEDQILKLKDEPTKKGNDIKNLLYRNKIFTNFVFN